MSFLCVNQMEEIIAKYIVNKTPATAESVVLHLYKNDKTPADGDTEGNYTEADFTGYTYQDCPGTDWSITPDAPTLATCAEKTFESTANQTPQNLYGYYLTQASSGKLVCVWRFNDGPYIIAEDGDQIKITPKISIKKVGE